MLEIVLQFLAAAAIFAGAVLLMVAEYGLRSQLCPYCSRGHAVFKRGRDLVCWRCTISIGRRIRATLEESPPPRPRIVR